MSSRQVRITKIFTLEMGHALLGHDGLCKNIHGHSYKLAVTIQGNPIVDPGNPKDGMVLDFGDLKRIIQKNITGDFDHALVLNSHTDTAIREKLSLHFDKVIFVAFQPTCENILLHFVDLIKSTLPASVELCKLRLDETATSFAEWYREDNL